MKKIVVKVERTETGFSAYAEKYAAFTTGKNSIELVRNMVESLNLYFEAEGKGKRVTATDISFEMEVTTIFEIFPVINVRALAGRIGMNHTLLSQYATGKKKASSKQTEKILDGIHEIGRELSELNLIR
ncbi:MAG TPA: hypothetical protein VIM75_20795 [Ohtaekwangia sp.]|uniref:hypothetical protein n=1 Tax=Ohtaekwangia sp. TaxID=2066019 RepID=UPI002F93915C